MFTDPYDCSGSFSCSFLLFVAALAAVRSKPSFCLSCPARDPLWRALMFGEHFFGHTLPWFVVFSVSDVVLLWDLRPLFLDDVC